MKHKKKKQKKKKNNKQKYNYETTQKITNAETSKIVHMHKDHWKSIAVVM